MKESGFSLVEALAAMAITVITVLGLSYSFGTGRALIDRHEISRAAWAVGQQRLETLAMTADTTQLTAGSHAAVTFVFQGINRGTEQWSVTWIDDPVDGSGSADSTGTMDIKKVTEVVRWNDAAGPDSIQLTRVFRGN